MKKNEQNSNPLEPITISRRNAIKTSLLAATSIAITPVYAAPPQVKKNMKLAVHPSIIKDESIFSFSSNVKRICNFDFEINPSANVSPVDEVLNGSAHFALTNICYEKNLPEILHLFSGIPFGMNLIETISWVKQGQGQLFFDEILAGMGLKAWIIKFKGASGGAWHNIELNSSADYKKKRIIARGLSQKVLEKMGAEIIETPIHEAKKAFETSQIDAIEGISPAESLDLGFERLDANYYWPGWQTPCESLFLVTKKKIFDSLPNHTQSGIEWLSYSNMSLSMSVHTYNNCLKTPILTSIPKIRIKRLPDDILMETAKITKGILSAISSSNQEAKKTYDSYRAFYNKAATWTQLGDEAFSLARSLTLSYLDVAKHNK